MARRPAAQLARMAATQAAMSTGAALTQAPPSAASAPVVRTMRMAAVVA
jgi:hypothetical protein